MILRKKRITILVISIILAVLIISGIIGVLYLKTDMFKSNEKLFAKYLMQNFNAVETLNNEDTLGVENTLNTNKYESKLEGKIQYIENIGTSDENNKSEINNIGIEINSNVDKQNNYDYKDIAIVAKNEDLVRLEYLNENELYGIRLNGIKQFVSIENDGENEILQELGVENQQGFLAQIDINSILNFTEEEKQSLMNTYIGIIQSNVTKDKYYKQANSLITINNQDVRTNSYYIKLTVEEYNNLYIKILEQITKDEVILSRIDLIENEIKQKYPNYEQDNSLKEMLINNINDKIQQIERTNIGSEEVKVIVYENNGKLVRTAIEKSMNKTTIDFYNDSSIKIDNMELGENVNEQYIKIEKNKNETQSTILIEAEKTENNEVINNIKLNYQQLLENNQLNRLTEIEILNEKYKGIFSIKNNIKFVEEFENEVNLDEDNIKLSDLQEEQIDAITSILKENIQGQISNISSIIDLKEYTKMLQNLEIIQKSSVQLPDTVEVTDIERKRFNSQFEFFVSENLTTDNIKDLMKIVQGNLEDVNVLLKNGETETLDVNKLNSTNQDSNEYKKNISEILISVKQDSKNTEMQEGVSKFIEDYTNNEYTVSLEYDNNGLVSVIKIKIQEE